MPWNPIGAIIGPLALFSLVARRRKSKANPYLLMVMMLVVLPLSVAMACSLGGSSTPTEEPTSTAQPPTAGTQTAPGTVTGGVTATPIPPTPSPTGCDNCAQKPPPPGNWEFVGKYKPSAYVINIEEDFLGGIAVPIPANPPVGVFEQGYQGPAYLSTTNSYGYYTADMGRAQYANENFLYSYASVCKQGSGKLVSGAPITCTTPVTWEGVAPESLRPNIKFQWGSYDRINNMKPHETVAVCPSYLGGKIPHPTLDNSLNLTGPRSKLWLTGTGIEEYFENHGASDSVVEVIDVGEGLCAENKIDIYIGDGLAALSYGYDDLVNGTSQGSITTEMDVYIQR